MFRALFKLMLLLLVVVVVGGFLAGWWGRAPQGERDAVATAGRAGAERAREVASQVGQKTAEAARVAEEVISDGSLTAKIKAKMALDDTVRALDLNIDTVNRTVTVSGKVRTKAEHERAIALARETNGVKSVVDKVTVTTAR